VEKKGKTWPIATLFLSYDENLCNSSASLEYFLQEVDYLSTLWPSFSLVSTGDGLLRTLASVYEVSCYSAKLCGGS
jgi:hypothetical protein